MGRGKIKWDGPLLFIMLVSAFLNGYNIWKEEFANTYYTTAVASMLQSFRNFFFASLDPAGTVTVDKPPVVFWIQTASAWLFGLHGWSVILPQVLAGVGSVLLLYLLVKPAFGTAAARVSALVMACTPVAVAVSRTNNIDSMLVFTLLLAAWLLFRGIREERTGSIIGAFAVIGIAFNMKMLQAYMVVPAFGLFYLIASKPGWRTAWKKKTGVLAAAASVLLVVTLSWPVIVDAIPKDKRPYIGSSQTDSVLELAFGYNGIARLTGEREGNGNGGPNRDGWAGNPAGGGAGAGAIAGGPGDGGAGKEGQTGNPGDGTGNSASRARDGGTRQGLAGQGAGGASNAGGQTGGGSEGGAAPNFGAAGGPNGGDGGRNGPGGGSNGRFNTGQAGPLRLFQPALSGQASWLIPFALIASIGLLGSLRFRNFTRQHKEVVFWLAWLVPGMVFFSIAQFFHQYYLIMLAPPIAALTGAGWSRLWDDYRNRAGWLSWLFPAAVAATAAVHWMIIHPYDAKIGKGWSIGIAAGGIAAVLILVMLKLLRQKAASYLAAAGMLVLLIGPVYWAATPIVYGLNSMLPQAGPGSADNRGGWTGPVGFGGSGGPGGPGGPSGPGGEGAAFNEALYAYLKENNTGEKYLFATVNYNTAAPYIIEKGEQVIITGGFSGNDPAVSKEELENWAAEGKVKYVLSGGGMGGRGGSTELTAWLQEHGTVVPPEEWGGGSGDSNSDTGSGFGGRGGGLTLYELNTGKGVASR